MSALALLPTIRGMFYEPFELLPTELFTLRIHEVNLEEFVLPNEDDMIICLRVELFCSVRRFGRVPRRIESGSLSVGRSLDNTTYCLQPFVG